MNKLIAIFVFLVLGTAHAQQLNCTVTVNAQKLSNSNLTVFKTLEKSLTEFINKTDWNGKVYQQNEKIDCSMYITVLSNTSDQFSATLQVQSSRPIFNSSYSSPVLNYNDKDFSFRYTEFENLIFNENSFDSNLVSVVAFYSYMILGMDDDTFVLESGDSNFEKAQNITNVAQQSGYKGWSQIDGNQNRYFLITDILSPTYSDIRKTIFEYHKGLDSMAKDLRTAKEKVKDAVANLSKLNSAKPNAFLTRLFFDAKSDEIVSIFSGGPSITVSDLIDNLNKVSPLNSNKWVTIKY
ncbi:MULTISPECIES: DUF4835 family protein [unclassified Flavobacterium]|uniref:type IX secretion system protein PorD n=1 Tax=unclassified Flavobacterium TaxID=196869 RepID=UPI003F8F139C